MSRERERQKFAIARQAGKSTLMLDIMEQDFAAEAAKNLSDRMDFDILCDTLVPFGWTRLEIANYGSDKKWIDVKAWAYQNCQDEFREHLGIWLFKNKSDATAFALKWIS